MSNKRYVDVVCIDYALDNGGEGTPFVELTLKCLTGEDTGRTIRTRRYLSDKATQFTMDSLRALGWTGTKLSKAMSEGLGTLKASAVIVPELGKNGKMYDNVKYINPIKPRGTSSPVDAGALEAFDALFEDAAANIAPLAANGMNKAPEKLPEPPVATPPVDRSIDYGF